MAQAAAAAAAEQRHSAHEQQEQQEQEQLRVLENDHQHRCHAEDAPLSVASVAPVSALRRRRRRALVWRRVKKVSNKALMVALGGGVGLVATSVVLLSVVGAVAVVVLATPVLAAAVAVGAAVCYLKGDKIKAAAGKAVSDMCAQVLEAAKETVLNALVNVDEKAHEVAEWVGEAACELASGQPQVVQKAVVAAVDTTATVLKSVERAGRRATRALGVPPKCPVWPLIVIALYVVVRIVVMILTSTFMSDAAHH